MGLWDQTFRVGSGLVRNWKSVAGLSATATLGWNYYFNDKGAVESLSDMGLGDKGLKGTVQHVVGGKDGEDKGLAENIVDAIGGDGTYGKARDTAGNLKDSLEAKIHGPQPAGDYQTGYNQAMQDAQQYYQQQMLQFQQQQMMMRQQPVSQQQMSGGGIFDSFGNLTSSILSGGKGLSLAALIPAAYMMFGNFGWLGKVASMMLGTFAYKNFNQQNVMNTAQQMSRQAAVALSPAGQEPLYRPAVREANDENVSTGLKI